MDILEDYQLLIVSSGFANEVLLGQGVTFWVVFVHVVHVSVAYHETIYARELSSYRTRESDVERMPVNYICNIIGRGVWGNDIVTLSFLVRMTKHLFGNKGATS